MIQRRIRDAFAERKFEDSVSKRRCSTKRKTDGINRGGKGAQFPRDFQLVPRVSVREKKEEYVVLSLVSQVEKYVN